MELTNHHLPLIYHTHIMKKSQMIFFEEAARECSKSHHTRHHHGSVATSGNRIISRGSNFNHVHAEVSSLPKGILAAHKNIQVYVVRSNNSGDLINSRPCDKCEKYMRKNGVSRVYFSSEKNEFDCIKF